MLKYGIANKSERFLDPAERQLVIILIISDTQKKTPNTKERKFIPVSPVK